MSDPIQILRTALVALLADLLREAEQTVEIRAHDGRYTRVMFTKARDDAAALRRVMEIVRRGGERGKEGEE